MTSKRQTLAAIEGLSADNSIRIGWIGVGLHFWKAAYWPVVMGY